MSVEYKLTEINDVLRLEINGNETATYEEYVAVVSEAKAKLKGDMELQTFVNVKHEAELEFFVSMGFYIRNTMLMMEKDLEENVDRFSSNIDADMVKLDLSDQGIDKYLEANKMGFDGVQDPKEQIVYQISQPNGTIYAAVKEDRILASVTTWSIDGETFATENIFTIPEYREKHLASSLLTYVLEDIKKTGAKTARLSVYGDDAPALLLYIKMGYHIVDSNYELRY